MKSLGMIKEGDLWKPVSRKALLLRITTYQYGKAEEEDLQR